MKGCGISLVGLVFGVIVAGWLLFHIGDIAHILDGLLKMVTGG